MDEQEKQIPAEEKDIRPPRISHLVLSCGGMARLARMLRYRETAKKKMPKSTASSVRVMKEIIGYVNLLP